MSKLIGHTSINIANEFILIFGGLLDGTDQTEYTDQLRVYEIASQSCIPITLSECEKPSPRNFHSACVYDNKMIIFGGKSNGYLNDVWQFEFDRKTLIGKWEKLSTVNDRVISPRFGHSAEVYNNSMFIFGGYDSDGFVSNQVFELNLKTFEWKCWTLKNKKNHEILARYFHSSLIYNNFMVISGGKKSGNNPISDILLIDLENCENQYLNCKIKKIPQSISRYGHKSWIHDDRLFILGGCNANHDFTTLHSIDLNEENNWREENFHFLSRVFNNSEIGPVFHTLTTYKYCETTSVMYYFVWGGKYQQSTSNHVSNENNGKLSVLNDDVLRLILVYLPVPDLNTVQLLGKHCLISQLSIEDEFWKKFTISKSENIKPQTCGITFSNYAFYLKLSHQQFKNHLIELGQIKTPTKFQFKPKQEILKQDLEYFTRSKFGEFAFRTTTIGSSNVGKTTMHMLLYDNKFPDEYVPTIFESDLPIPVTLNTTHSFTLQMRDTAGGIDYERLRYLSFSPPTNLTLIMYSIYDHDSFLRVKDSFINEARLHAPKTPILLVGSKSDLRNNSDSSNFYLSKEKRKIISYEEGEKLARELNCLSFTEISSRTMEGIEELKELIVKLCLLQDSQLSNNGKKCLIQ